MANEIPSRRYEISSCAGKVSFETPQLAAKVLLRKRGNRRSKGVRWASYHCLHCGKFHIGTKT